MAKVKTPRWALTGSGHFSKERLAMIGALDEVDEFVSRAAAEVVRMYKQAFGRATRILRFDPANVVKTLEALGAALARRKNELAAHG